jgi:F-type H+-transporting ATPase subunit delta
LRQRLRDLTGKTILLEFRHDPAILGGLIVRVGNRIYDASVVTQLQRFKERALSTV